MNAAGFVRNLPGPPHVAQRFGDAMSAGDAEYIGLRRRGEIMRRHDRKAAVGRDWVEAGGGTDQPRAGHNGRNDMSLMKTTVAGLGLATFLATGLFTGTAFAGDAASCKTVRLSDVGWSDIQATTGVASVLLTALGYEPQVIQLSVPVTYASLKNKDLDVFLGNWMPSMTNDIKEYTADGSVDRKSVV